MPISKEIIIEISGAKASHHVVRSVCVDVVALTTTATVRTYVDADAFAAGKQPIIPEYDIVIAGNPAIDAGAFPFAEAQLVASVPTDGSSTSTLPNSAARYLLADGVIVDAASAS